MSNFYGGRDGKAFVITAFYESIKEMTKDFFGSSARTKKGVGFNDYVLIQTQNRNNPENGRIYKRGLDYNGVSNNKIDYYNPNNLSTGYKLNDTTEAYGAEYIGQIVGPAGRPPALRITSYTEALDYQNIVSLEITLEKDQLLEDYLNEHAPSGLVKGKVYIGGEEVEMESAIAKIANSEYYCQWNPYAEYDAETNQPIGSWERFTVAPTISGGKNDSAQMIPAAVINVDDTGTVSVSNEYNSIDWAYFSYRNINEEDTLALLGFRFVTPINYFTSESVSAYYKDAIVTHVQDHEDNPFLDHWQLRIPKGIKGDAMTNFRVESIAAQQTGIEEFVNGVLQPKNFEVNETAFLCDYYSYDENVEGKNYVALEQGTKHIIYLGEYEQIAEIAMDADGNLSFTGTSNYTFNTVLTWVNKCQYNEATGFFTFGLNNSANGVETNDFSVNLRTVNQLEMRDQQLYAIYNTTENTEESLGTFLISGPEEDPRAVNNLMTGGIWLVTEEV